MASVPGLLFGGDVGRRLAGGCVVAATGRCVHDLPGAGRIAARWRAGVAVAGGVVSGLRVPVIGGIAVAGSAVVVGLRIAVVGLDGGPVAVIGVGAAVVIVIAAVVIV